MSPVYQLSEDHKTLSNPTSRAECDVNYVHSK